MVLAGAVLVSGLAFFLLVEFAGGFPSSARSPLLYLFSALTGGNFTLITIIVSINQLVISRQLSTPGELRQEIEETNRYRESVIETLPEDHVAPVTPTEFLHLLLRAIRESLGRLEHTSENIDDEEARELLESLIDELTSHIDHVDDLLQESDTGVFNALAATLTTNYSQHIYHARELQKEYADGLSEDDVEQLDELVLLLQQIDVARQYLKTLYMQDELSRLSRRLLVVGLPAVFTCIAMLQLFGASNGAIISMETLSGLTPVVVTIALAPLAVVFSFVLRISAVSQRTVAITPFTTASQEL